MFSVITVLVLTSSLWAQVYRYKDGNGVLHFTDNILEVPPAQRQTVDVYSEIQSASTSSGPKESVPEQKDGVNTLQKEYQNLLKEQAVLDQRFQELDAQKKELDNEKKGLSSPEQLEAYKAKIRAFNKEVTVFTERKQIFGEKSQSFNHKNKRVR